MSGTSVMPMRPGFRCSLQTARASSSGPTPAEPRGLEVPRRNWFQHHLAGRPRKQIAGNSQGDAESWHVADEETIASVIAEYEDACAESRRIAAGFALDHTVPQDQLGPVSLRWIYVHILREHARHIGHADIIREQIDGATGD